MNKSQWREIASLDLGQNLFGAQPPAAAPLAAPMADESLTVSPAAKSRLAKIKRKVSAKKEEKPAIKEVEVVPEKAAPTPEQVAATISMAPAPKSSEGLLGVSPLTLS